MVALIKHREQCLLCFSFVQKNAVRKEDLGGITELKNDTCCMASIDDRVINGLCERFASERSIGVARLSNDYRTWCVLPMKHHR